MHRRNVVTIALALYLRLGVTIATAAFHCNQWLNSVVSGVPTPHIAVPTPKVVTPPPGDFLID